MITKIIKDSKIVGKYEHDNNTMESVDDYLKSIPIDGVVSITGKTDKKGNQVTQKVVVMPDSADFFFALVDNLERWGYSVDDATTQEYIKRMRAKLNK